MAKKLFVGNISWGMDTAALQAAFASYGEIEDCIVITDKFSGRSKGFGFVTFTDDAAADAAIAEMNGKEMEGRELVVNEARPREERPPRQF
ncbi:MAG: RNA-binding protein [Candidatus Gracilibacteria bacterium]|nr:RNA-binding protein [Candidatus Gracilibacteria bacterium]